MARTLDNSVLPSTSSLTTQPGTTDIPQHGATPQCGAASPTRGRSFMVYRINLWYDQEIMCEHWTPLRWYVNRMRRKRCFEERFMVLKELSALRLESSKIPSGPNSGSPSDVQPWNVGRNHPMGRIIPSPDRVSARSMSESSGIFQLPRYQTGDHLVPSSNLFPLLSSSSPSNDDLMPRISKNPEEALDDVIRTVLKNWKQGCTLYLRTCVNAVDAPNGAVFRAEASSGHSLGNKGFEKPNPERKSGKGKGHAPDGPVVQRMSKNKRLKEGRLIPEWRCPVTARNPEHNAHGECQNVLLKLYEVARVSSFIPCILQLY